MLSSFSTRGVTGVTFIYPKEPALRKKIMEAADSDPEQAERYLKSLILTDIFQTPQDFKNKEDDIPNRLNISVPIEKVSGDSVILKCGIEIKKDKNFKTLESRSNICVYTVIKGDEFPTEGKVSERKYNRRVKGQPAKTGGSREYSSVQHVTRGNILGEAKNAYNKNRVTGKLNVNGNSFVSFTASLLTFIEKAKNGSETVPGIDTDVIRGAYERALCVLDPNPEASFFLLFEPFKTSGQFTIDVEIIKAWWDKTQGVITESVGGEILPNPGSTYLEYINKAANEIMVDRTHANTDREDARRSIFDAGYSKLATPGQVRKYYRKLESSNKYIDGGTEIYKSGCASFMQRPGFKQWVDEIRYHVGRMFRTLDTDLMYTAQELSETLRVIEYLYPGNDYPSEIRVDSAKYGQLLTPTEEFFTNVVGFIRSHAFLHVPRTVDEIQTFASIKRGGCEGSDPSSMTILPTDVKGIGAVEYGGVLGGAMGSVARKLKSRLEAVAQKGMKVAKDYAENPEQYHKKLEEASQGVLREMQGVKSIASELSKTGDELMNL
jgi:hypothetical protein